MKNLNLSDEKLNHSASHVLAQAMQKLFPKAKLGIGPAIENGFYYDFDLDNKISEQDLEKISDEMTKIIEQDLPIISKEISINEAKELFESQPFKLELIDDLSLEGIKSVSVYYTGNKFFDLCKGPHLKSTGEIKALKLNSVAGAYWKGKETNKMLTRIYGAAFLSQKDMEKYLWRQEELKKRDHRKIGKDLDLFSIDPDVGPGLILWHPKLSIVREEIELYWRKEHRKRGYEYVYTPHVGIDNLWKTSGHLENYKESMYPEMKMPKKDKEEETKYYVKPMNCPFHIKIYKSRPRSYRELPLRWCELGTVYRYEESGVLHGMLRVRGFTQDDAHIICTESQFVEEINKVLDFALNLNSDFGFKELKVYLSVRGTKKADKYVGKVSSWEMAEKTLEEILKERKIKFEKDIGGAKFYGPAIDLKAVDPFGREWQGTTIQLDFNNPERFSMTYTGEDGKEHTPIMIHRTLLGAMERFIGTLIEMYEGAFPVWLSPQQVAVLPISEDQFKSADKIQKELSDTGIRSVLLSNQTLNSRIRQAQLEKIPYMLIIGKREVESKTVSLRLRTGKDKGEIKLTDFITLVKNKVKKKSII